MRILVGHHFGALTCARPDRIRPGRACVCCQQSRAEQSTAPKRGVCSACQGSAHLTSPAGLPGQLNINSVYTNPPYLKRAMLTDLAVTCGRSQLGQGMLRQQVMCGKQCQEERKEPQAGTPQPASPSPPPGWQRPPAGPPSPGRPSPGSPALHERPRPGPSAADPRPTHPRRSGAAAGRPGPPPARSRAAPAPAPPAAPCRPCRSARPADGSAPVTAPGAGKEASSGRLVQAPALRGELPESTAPRPHRSGPEAAPGRHPTVGRRLGLSPGAGRARGDLQEVPPPGQR